MNLFFGKAHAPEFPDLLSYKIYNKQIFFWNAVKKYFAYENKYKTILCPSFFENGS